jgi:hypothetical protein
MTRFVTPEEVLTPRTCAHRARLAVLATFG